MRSFCAFAKLPAINNRKAIMAGVNGVEIKVGQVWRTRGGALATVESFDDHPNYPVNINVEGDSASCGRNGRCWGDIGAVDNDDDDLIELIHDENGNAQTDSATLAEETLSALGWPFDGQAWVEQSKADLPVGMVEGDDREYTGGSVSYYKVPVSHPTSGGEPYDAECNDLIEALGMNFAEGNAFKAIWRLCAARRGLSKRGYDESVYDAEKVVFFGQRMVVQQREGGA